MCSCGQVRSVLQVSEVGSFVRNRLEVVDRDFDVRRTGHREYMEDLRYGRRQRLQTACLGAERSRRSSIHQWR